MLNIIKRILPVMIAVVVAAFSASAFEGQWRLHPTFDGSQSRLLDTPRYVYMLALAQPYSEGVPESPTRQGFLYVYDKENDEFYALHAQGPLTQSVISDIEYNSKRGYLLIIYEDLNIDLLYDDGRVVNIPAIKSASIPSSKKVNGIYFDSDRRQIDLATDFGFIIIDDEKGEIYESRIYNRPIVSIARCGDFLLVSDDEGSLFYAPATAHNFAFEDFSPVNYTADRPGHITKMFRVSPTAVGLLSDLPEGSEAPQEYGFIEFMGDQVMPDEPVDDEPADDDPTGDEPGAEEDEVDEPEAEPVYGPMFRYSPTAQGTYKYMTESRNGPLLWEATRYALVTPEGTCIGYTVPNEVRSGLAATYNGQEFWNTQDRKGLRMLKGGDKPALVKDFMLPDAPSVYISQDMAYSPKYGLLVSNRGNANYFASTNYYRPILLSGLKNGEWVRHGLPYTNPDRNRMMYNPQGLAIDPQNPDMVYFGSLISGIGRINLSDPKDILHMSTSNDPAASYPEFVDMLPVSELWSRSARMAAPKFDALGNLWSVFNNIDSEHPTEVWVWPRVNIDATKDAKSFKPWIKIPITKYAYTSLNSMALPLSGHGNDNRVVLLTGSYQTGPVILDHKGTLSNTADDVQVVSNTLYDQDNQPNPYNYLRTMIEDPATGLVWFGCDNGVFTLHPSTFMANPGLINRIKVARDDGTSLADYLLNGVDVSSILIDPAGRKWFGTVGGGLVCTSGDGRTVKGEWTVENSPLPDNNIYGLGWNEDTGSLMISTGKGLVEFFPSGEGDGKDFEQLRIFPNPVRPDYFGWVTIDGLTEGALVKITDAHGNLIRELGRVNGGTVQWDVANLNGSRVPSGVYYVLASGGENDQNLAKIGKILVVN